MRFCFSVENKFPQIPTKAMKVLIPFTSTYLCECGFSALTLIKNKHKPRLVVEDLHLFLFAVQPRIEHLCASKARPLFSLIWTIKLKVKVVLP